MPHAPPQGAFTAFVDSCWAVIADMPVWIWFLILATCYFFGVIQVIKTMIMSARQSMLDWANSWAGDGVDSTTGKKKTKSPKIKRFMFVDEQGRAVMPNPPRFEPQN
jgi:hypothetical protein